jgi:tRNA (guanine37-N1)-methyltransferase
MNPALQIDVLTLFPGMLAGFLQESIIGRGVDAGIIGLRVHNIRDWADDRHQVTDDRPFGGGAGMVLKPEPIFAAIEELRTDDSLVVYSCPDGEQFTSGIACELANARHVIVLSGHYEGIDQRVRDELVDREISIGDYVLTNGTLPAAVIVDAVSRFVPGVLGEEMSLTQDSFTDNLLSFPQYTRPAEFRGMRVPDVLLSGNHAEIQRWRDACRLEKTRTRRPDLFQKFKEEDPHHEPDH